MLAAALRSGSEASGRQSHRRRVKIVDRSQTSRIAPIALSGKETVPADNHLVEHTFPLWLRVELLDCHRAEPIYTLLLWRLVCLSEQVHSGPSQRFACRCPQWPPTRDLSLLLLGQ